jgi:hypothetical protein
MEVGFNERPGFVCFPVQSEKVYPPWQKQLKERPPEETGRIPLQEKQDGNEGSSECG